MTDTLNVVAKLVESLSKTKGYPYAAGYLESLLANTIDKYVPEDQKPLVRIELLTIAAEYAIDNLGNK